MGVFINLKKSRYSEHLAVELKKKQRIPRYVDPILKDLVNSNEVAANGVYIQRDLV